MEWAEELKLTIQKTARKGRRSRSRDPLKSTSQADKEISLDISVELNQQKTNETDSDNKRPPRRISGVWAETGLKPFKLNRSKNKSVIEDERFKNSTAESNQEDIPTIPDLDEIKNDNILKRAVKTSPKKSDSCISTLKENYSDLLSQNAFTGIEGVDLRILMRRLQSAESIDEPHELWEWNKLFTDVVAEINSDKTCGNGKTEVSSDEIRSFS